MSRMRRRASATATAALSAFFAARIAAAAGAPPVPGAAAPGTAAESPGAFYLARMAIGRQALAAGRAGEAADNLRVASFGLLGDPEKLTECLVWLAIAQQRAGRTADVDATLKRFDSVQALFPSYGEIALGPEVRSEFEALARKRAPGMALERPREARRREPPPAPASSPRPPPEAPAPAPGPAPAAVPLASGASPRRLVERPAQRIRMVASPARGDGLVGTRTAS